MSPRVANNSYICSYFAFFTIISSPTPATRKEKHTLTVCFSFFATRVANGLDPHDLRPFEPILWRRKIIVVRKEKLKEAHGNT